MPDALWVVVGAVIGAPLRYLAGLVLNTARFPWGTLAVNVAGSFILGAVVDAGLPGWAATALGTGFCGALTTYSAFGYETLVLAADGTRVRAAANVALNVCAGLGAAFAGAAVRGIWA